MGFEEASGTTATDQSTFGNNGTLVNGVTRASAGRFGKCVQFDGINDIITVADSASLDITTAITLEAWIFPLTTMSGAKTAIVKERTSTPAYHLYPNSGTNVPAGGGFIAAVSKRVLGPSPLPINVGSHLAFTYDGATERLYVNGAQVASKATTGTIATTTNALRLGGNTLLGNYFNGRIDEARIYNRALSAGEIQADMNTAVSVQPGRVVAEEPTPVPNAAKDWFFYG